MVVAMDVSAAVTLIAAMVVAMAVSPAVTLTAATVVSMDVSAAKVRHVAFSKQVIKYFNPF
jgi:hypothetical protein